jgi:hypothetical protein
LKQRPVGLAIVRDERGHHRTRRKVQLNRTERRNDRGMAIGDDMQRGQGRSLGDQERGATLLPKRSRDRGAGDGLLQPTAIGQLGH